MASDEEDFVFFGTPIEREEDITSRKKKSIAEASGQLRTLAPWKQEVRDEEGRRRFHGAFSGGFSAGYFNTVGSKEGWTPQTFTSSRKNRAEIKQQDLSNFLDDDEKAELEGNSLGTSMQFDTFGFTAAEMARKQVEKEQNERPSAIPGPAPDEIVVPATDPIGVRLMLKMGWRRGHSLNSSKASSLYDARREARKAFLALSEDAKTPVAGPTQAEAEDDMASAAELSTDGVSQFHKSTPVYVLNPKQDMHGLGYDPFKGAPEFRENKRPHLPGNKESGHKRQPPKKDGLFSFKTRNVAPGFGIGALEELDAEDEDVYASGYDFEAFVEEIEEPTKLAIEDKKKSTVKQHGILPGFKLATNSDYQLERFDPPVVPKDFVPHHKFPATSEVNHKMTELPPKDVPPPEDNSLKVLIEGVATLVARCGPLFEELSREKNQSNPLFDFLNGGNGHDYYKRKLWEAKQKHGDKFKPLLKEKATPNTQKMTAESRGNILGEKPLVTSVAKDVPVKVTETVNLQFHLSDTFTEPSSFVEPTEMTKPFQHDPAKQDRFEQYMKEKYHGGLRTKDAGGSSKMSESARARERLEFEAAAEAIAQGKWGKESQPSGQQILGVPGGRGLQFTSGGSEKMEVSRGEKTIEKSMFPKREEFQWRPASILCKRFDLIDPYMGKPPPPPRSRSKLDSLIFMPDYVKAATEVEKTFSNNKLPVSQLDEKGETSVEDIVERPVDLYKAIFSDDSDDEEGSSNIIINQPQPEDPTKKIEAANTTLSRLVAGDFLESLGKELGLEVPPENHVNVKPPHPTQKSTLPEPPQKHEPVNSDSHKDISRIQEKSFKNDTSKLNHEKRDTKVERKGSSSEDDRKRKRSKRHRNRNRGTYPGGVSKWQWKRMQAKKAKQLLRARLARERQVYEMRKRAELSAAISELERPWEVVEKAPKLFSTSADEQLKVLADRFQKPGGFDLWSEKDGPQLFETVDGIPSARFFPKGVVHSIKPYGRITDGYSPEEPDLVHRDEHDEKSRKFEKNNTGIGYSFPDDDSGLILRNGHDESSRKTNGKSTKEDSRRRIRTGLDSGRDGVNQKDSGSIWRKDTKRGNGRKEHSASNSEVFDMSLQDDGSYGILKEEMKITKNRQEHR